jgi:shikimate dehydrogenase
MKRYGLIGYPLSHSFSKKYFEEKFRQEGITDCAYELFPIESIEQLTDVLHAHPDLHGLNVTIPYKELVIPFLHDTSHLPNGLRACNCVRIEDGRLTGFNTDIIGFEKSFMPLLKPHHKQALVLGSGGAASAVAFTLERLGINYKIVSRSRGSRSALTYDDLNESIMATHHVIVNTTPLGMYPGTDAYPPLPYEYIGPEHYLYDVVYNPAKTAFLRKGEERGAATRNGAEMLVIQAEESWKIWSLPPVSPGTDLRG